MSALLAELEDLKSLLRGILISSPRSMTADQLQRDYRNLEGRDVPYRKLGYSSFQDFLLSIPDTVIVRSLPGGGSPIVTPVQSEKSSHVDALVQKQKITAPKRRTTNRFSLPIRRTSVKAPPEIYRNHNNNFDNTQRILIPHHLQQRIYKFLQTNPQGVGIHVLEREFFSGQILRNYGIHCDGIQQLLAHLEHLLKVSGGMVYPLLEKSSVYRPVIQQVSNEDKDPKNFVPAGYENHFISVEEKNDFLEEDMKFNEEDDKDIASELSEHAGEGDNIWDTSITTTSQVTSVVNKEKVCDTPSETLQSPEISPPSCAYSSDLVSHHMRRQFRILLDKNPDGIWCSELPQLYKEEFGVPLEYLSMGFVSLVQMASNILDIFHCVRPDGTTADWKVFDARKTLPSQYTFYDIKKHKHVSTNMVPKVPPKVKNNLERLLMAHPSGLPSDQLLNNYQAFFLSNLNINEMGFDTLESFLLSLNDDVLHLRYMNQRIVLYPQARDPEPASDDPLLITEPCELYLDLYPPEVVGPKYNLLYQKIPPETAKGSHLEVLVAEVYTPQNFWIQLRGEKTHVALDKLMNDIQDFYDQEEKNYHMPDSTVKIGQYCMAPYNEEWHRVHITAVHNLIEVQVLFVDYGTSSKEKMKDLRFMHQDFAAFPMQAIQASLANIMPAGDGKKWPRAVNKRFLEMVSEKTLIAIVSSVDHEARKLEIALVDTSGAEDIHINDVLEQDGLAQFVTSRQPRPPSPPPQRIDVDLTPPTVTVSRPPPGFSSGPKVMSQQSFPVTGQSFSTQKTATVQDLQNQTYPQFQTPHPNTNQPPFLPPQAPYMNPLQVFPSSYVPQAVPVQQQFSLYEQLQSAQLIQNLMLINPALGLLVSSQMLNTQVRAAAMNNAIALSGYNPTVMYSPPPMKQRTTVDEGAANAGRPEVDISEISTALPKLSPKYSASHYGPNQSVLSESCAIDPIVNYPPFPESTVTDATIWQGGVTTCTRESPPLFSVKPHCDKVDQGTQHILLSSVQTTINSSSPQKDVETVLSTSVQATIDSFSPQKKVETVHDDTVESASNCAEITEETQGVAESVTQSGPPEDLSFSCTSDSDEIYRSDDDDVDDEDDDDDTEETSPLPPQPPPPPPPPKVQLKPHCVKKIEMAKKMVHLINIFNTAYLSVDEIVRLFTDFSGRHVVLKILDAKGIRLPFYEIDRRGHSTIFDVLDKYNIVGLPKNLCGYIMGNVSLIPLRSVCQLLTLLSVRGRNLFQALQEEVEKFDPLDEYWTGSK